MKFKSFNFYNNNVINEKLCNIDQIQFVLLKIYKFIRLAPDIGDPKISISHFPSPCGR
jgi:hypothetical protein